MVKKGYNILLISSRPPHFSAGLGKASCEAFEKEGHHIDYMTLYDYPGKDDNVITLLPDPASQPQSALRRFVVLPVRRILKFIGLYGVAKIVKDVPAKKKAERVRKELQEKGNISFLYPDESNPPVPVDLITRNIKRKYDAVITGFWEDMLNSTSLVAIYEKLRCPILIGSPDMAPMTGGCYYFGNCRNFHNGCGNCPALGSKDREDRSRMNYRVKKENYARINCAFLGNTWMRKHAADSRLFANMFNSEVTVDPETFSPADISQARNELRIADAGQFLILVSSSAQPRKGNRDIVEAIRILVEELARDLKQAIELLVIGDGYFTSLLSDIDLKYHYLGYVDTSCLANCYRAANLFISASNDDAGPSMVNQSLMCGTPVVCYDNGTALDVVENFESGYKVEPGDKKGLAEGIYNILSLSPEKYNKLRKSSREMALTHNSPAASVRNKIAAIEALIKNRK